MLFIYNKIYANRSLFAKILLASFLVNILALATPIYVIQVLQRYVAYGVMSTLVTLFIGIVLIVIFEFFFKNIRHRMARQYEMENIMYTNNVLNKFVSIKPKFYEAFNNFRNEVINHHLVNIQNTFSSTNIITIIDVPFTLIFLIALFLIHYQLGLIAILFVLLPFLINKFTNDRIKSLSQKMTLENNKSFRLFENVITRNSTIRYFNIINYITKSWNNIANSTANTRENYESEKNIVSSLSGLTASLLTIFIISWGAVLAVDGEISVGALIGANILAARALMPVSRYISLQESLQRMENSFYELDKFNNYEIEKYDGREIQQLKGILKIQDAAFTYPDQKNPVFETLNFEISAGELLVINGNNGSGKTTLIKNLAGLLEFSRGTFLIDDIEINQLSPNWYRNHVVYSPQEPQFVDGSVKDNVMGGKEINQNELVNILNQTDLSNFINNDKNEIDKILNLKSNQLPLGIRKRLSLLRALMNGGKIVYLDEPIEGLDEIGCKAVITILKKFKSEKRTVIVASNHKEIIDLSDALIDLNSKPKPNFVRHKK